MIPWWWIVIGFVVGIVCGIAGTILYILLHSGSIEAAFKDAAESADLRDSG